MFIVYFPLEFLDRGDTLYLLRASAMVHSSEEASSACQKRLYAGIAKQIVLQ